jgi:hypothetical protein
MRHLEHLRGEVLRRPEIGGMVHTHSNDAASFAMLGCSNAPIGLRSQTSRRGDCLRFPRQAISGTALQEAMVP